MKERGGEWRAAVYRNFETEAEAIAHAVRLCAAGYRVSVDRHRFGRPVSWAEQWEAWT